MELRKLVTRVVQVSLLLALLVALVQCQPQADAPLRRGKLASVHDNVTLLSTIGGSSEQPSWSPDGTQIAFQHTDYRLGSQDSLLPRDIYVMTSNGKSERRLTARAEDTSCTHPSWAPNGYQMVIACKTEPGTGIYLLDVGTGALTQLVNDPGKEAAPAWSSDGSQFAFAQWYEGEPYTTTTIFSDGQIYTTTWTFASYIRVADNDGSETRQLTQGPCDTNPAWSPDGQTISFTSHGGNCAERPFLCTIGVDGSALACNRDVDCEESAWSPDGSLIACISRSGIIATRPGGGQAVVLLDEKDYSITGLSWSPDGSRLAFTAGPMASVANDLYILDLRAQASK